MRVNEFEPDSDLSVCFDCRRFIVVENVPSLGLVARDCTPAERDAAARLVGLEATLTYGFARRNPGRGHECDRVPDPARPGQWKAVSQAGQGLEVGRGDPNTTIDPAELQGLRCAPLHTRPVTPDNHRVCDVCGRSAVAWPDLFYTVDPGFVQRRILFDPGFVQRRILRSYLPLDILIAHPWAYCLSSGLAIPHECPPITDDEGGERS